MIPARYEHCSLSDFDTSFDGAHYSLATACLAAGRFVEEYPIDKTGLLLTGPVGTGKTHLAVGIIKLLIHTKGISCLFCDYRELLKEIQNSYNSSVQTTELEILRPIFDTEVVVLDELGAVRSSEWVWDTVSHILNYRYNEKKTTIITTNFDDLPSHKAQKQQPRKSRQAEDAEKAGREETLGDRITDRMRSRLHEMCRIIELDGIDFRTGPNSVTQRVRSQIPSKKFLQDLRGMRGPREDG
jgi:DNA replication protein DnaC